MPKNPATPRRSTAKATVNAFTLKFSNFNEGFSPGAAFNSLTEEGNAGQASAMSNVELLSPDYITQGPGLANLTNGTQAAAVTELITFIIDQAISAGTTYGIGATKLFQITTSAVTNSGIWPHTITGSTGDTAGPSIIEFKGNIYYFFNKASGGDIGKYDEASSFTDNWGSTVPTGAAALQAAAHPVATKFDLIVFGNGRYVGTYTGATATLAPTMLDFGTTSQVADVCFNANQWVIAVNSGVAGSNKNQGHIYLWSADATSATLDDEICVGPYKIGFLFPIGGVVYVAYQDLTTSAGYKIGYISGRTIVSIGYFTGSLPTFAQKSMYKNTIIFQSAGLIYSAGALTDHLPNQISQLASGGYGTVGAIAAPFGTPMVASTDGGSNFRLAQFSGFDITGSWRSIVIPIISGRLKGMIDNVIVLTKTLAGSAKCLLKLEFDQNSANSGTAKQITGTGKRRFLFSGFSGSHEDFRIFLDYSSGDPTNDCAIRQIIVKGHWSEIS